jgi:hypothetical protein
MSAIGKAKASAVKHEWSLQELDAVNTANARLEGDALTRATSTAPGRKNNYCQISSRDATVTGTQRATNPAGIDDMMAYQMSLKSLVLRKDMEAILLGIYSLVVWLVFIKFKLLPWTTPWKVAVFIFPVVAMAAMLLLLNIFAPTSTDVRVV